MTASAEPRIRLAALTGIRGVAAWFVVLFHVRTGVQSQLPAPVLAMLDKGYLAVDLFFMLSGFVLWLNYSDRLRAEGPGGMPRFLARRLARIWPLHMFILACVAAFALVRHFSGHAGSGQYPWAELPLHVLLVQNWGFTTQLAWNDPAWSISCEFAAYLLFPLLVLRLDWRSLSSRALVMVILLLALALHLLMGAGGAATLGADIPRFGLPRALIEFAIGTILCVLWSRWRDIGPSPLRASLAVALLLATVQLVAPIPETLAFPALLAATLLALALAGQGPRNPFAWRWVGYLGEISYATYLAHFLLYILFKLVFVEDASRVPLPLIGLFLLLTLLASAALHHLLERPAQRRLNRLIDQWRPLAATRL